MTVEQIIFEMLTECTSVALCDSGGVRQADGTTKQGYGRNWERNQARDLATFQNEPDVMLEFDDNGNVESYTISVFHYLARQLDLDNICEKFNKINCDVDNWDDDRFYGVSNEAGQFLDNLDKGEMWAQESFNSYNDESNLSQVIQGTYITINDTPYLVLQIHGGCDVRGGYTNARLFLLGNDYGECLAPEDVYGTFTPNGADLETPCFDGQVDSEIAGVIEFSNVYDGYTLNRIHNDWDEFELNQNKGKITVGLCL